MTPEASQLFSLAFEYFMWFAYVAGVGSTCLWLMWIGTHNGKVE